MKKHHLQRDSEAISNSRLTQFSLRIQLVLFKAHLRLISLFEKVQARWLNWLHEEILSIKPLTPSKRDVALLKDWSTKNQYIACASNYIERHLKHAGIVTKCKVYLFCGLDINEELPFIHINSFGTHRCDLLRTMNAILELFPLKPEEIIRTFGFKAPLLRSTLYDTQSADGDHSGKQINLQLIEDLRAFTGVRIKGPNTDIYPTWRKVEAIRVFRDFQKDTEYGHLKLKWASKKPFKPELPFYVPDGLIRFVEFEEFLVDKASMWLPLFLGSQMGITPKYESCGTFRDGALHVILSKSMLSGTVNSLSLKRWVSAKNSFETIKAWY
jgi:hypothetical protein